MDHQLQVPAEAAGQRLDVWLEHQLAGCSRSLVARCIAAGHCLVTPGKTKAGYRLRGGEQVAIAVPEIESLDVQPEDIPLDVLYEDEDLLLVNKPPGMVVHPAIGHPRGTLLAAVLGRYDCSPEHPQAPGLIHRLDADTSGVIAVARHPQALAFYQAQFAQRQVGKQYATLLAGSARADWWSCHASLARHRKDFRKRAVVTAEYPGARIAHTDFMVRERQPHYMAVEARLHTGRTHQIRVHAAHAQHPVLADAVYGRHGHWPLSGPAVLTRQALHSWKLVLPRPDGSHLSCTAPIPADMAALMSEGLEPSALPVKGGYS